CAPTPQPGPSPPSPPLSGTATSRSRSATTGPASRPTGSRISSTASTAPRGRRRALGPASGWPSSPRSPPPTRARPRPRSTTRTGCESPSRCPRAARRAPPRRRPPAWPRARAAPPRCSDASPLRPGEAGLDPVEQAVQAELEPLVPGLRRVRVDARLDHRGHVRVASRGADPGDEIAQHRVPLGIGEALELLLQVALAVDLLRFAQDGAQRVGADRLHDGKDAGLVEAQAVQGGEGPLDALQRLRADRGTAADEVHHPGVAVERRPRAAGDRL